MGLTSLNTQLKVLEMSLNVDLTRAMEISGTVSIVKFISRTKVADMK